MKAMRTTTLAEYQSELVATGGYRTHDDCRSPRRARPGAWTTLRYTIGTVSVTGGAPSANGMSGRGCSSTATSRPANA